MSGGGGVARRRLTVALVGSALLVAALAAVLLRDGDPVRGIAYGVLGEGSVLAVALLARRAPGPAVAVAGALSTGAAVLQTVPPFALLPFAIATVLALVRGRTVWAVASVSAAYAVAVTAVFVSERPGVAGRGLGTMAILLVALGAGAFARTRLARRREEERAHLAQQQRAVEEERLRIARELHDVLAHSLSSITVQAGVGLHLAPARPEAATEALETIRDASRSALDEVRGVLGILREDAPAPREPGRGLDALPALVDEVRRSGARVELDDRVDPRPSMPVQLAAYRIVQEALTNARRHATGSAVTVALDRADDAVVVRVRDDRPGARAHVPVPGNGIAGMRERAAALGGGLDLVPHDGGLEVVARLPVDGGRAP